MIHARIYNKLFNSIILYYMRSKKKTYIPKGACQFFWTGGPKGTGCLRSNCKYKHGMESNKGSIKWNPGKK